MLDNVLCWMDKCYSWLQCYCCCSRWPTGTFRVPKEIIAKVQGLNGDEFNNVLHFSFFFFFVSNRDFCRHHKFMKLNISTGEILSGKTFWWKIFVHEFFELFTSKQTMLKKKTKTWLIECWIRTWDTATNQLFVISKANAWQATGIAMQQLKCYVDDLLGCSPGILNHIGPFAFHHESWFNTNWSIFDGLGPAERVMNNM